MAPAPRAGNDGADEERFSDADGEDRGRGLRRSSERRGGGGGEGGLPRSP